MIIKISNHLSVHWMICVKIETCTLDFISLTYYPITSNTAAKYSMAFYASMAKARWNTNWIRRKRRDDLRGESKAAMEARQAKVRNIIFIRPEQQRSGKNIMTLPSPASLSDSKVYCCVMERCEEFEGTPTSKRQSNHATTHPADNWNHFWSQCEAKTTQQTLHLPHPACVR